MGRLLLTLIILSYSVALNAQRIKETFCLKAYIDNARILHLERDNSYKYMHWSGFGAEYTLDSGIYQLSDHKLTLISQHENNLDTLPHSSYYIEKVRLNKYEWPISFGSVNEKKALFSKKYLVLSSKPFNSSMVIDLSPASQIQIDAIPATSGLKDWISNSNLVDFDLILPSKPADSTWTEMNIGEQVEVLFFDNGWGIFKTFFRFENELFTTVSDLDIKYPKAIVKKLIKEGKLESSDGRKILKIIENKIESISKRNADLYQSEFH